MSGSPAMGVGGNVLVLTLEEGKRWAKDTAALIDARLHGGQSGTKRTDIIEAELLKQMDKAAL